MTQLDHKRRRCSRAASSSPPTRSRSPRTRRLDERRQRALTRYYIAAGAGGLAVGVHTTQFAIRDPRIGLFEPVLATGRGGNGPRRPHAARAAASGSPASAARRAQAVREAELLADSATTPAC